MVEQSNVLLLVFFSILLSCAAIQLFYYFFFYLTVYQYNPTVSKAAKQPVSIIICARDEAENLIKFLPSVLEQDYPDYEVIVVNDCSEDNTFDILATLQLKYPHLKISNIIKDPKFTHNKKFAQFIGIKAAKNEIMLFIDADCQPESYKWIEGMASHFDENINIVIGYGKYNSEKGLLNKYIRYDNFMIAMQYLGMAIRGIPYMGVGRNLAYRRSFFFEKKGFGLHNHIASGDDDLFVNTNATRTNSCVEFSDSTHTKSVPCSGVNEWIKQKKRHLTTAPYYKLKDKLLLTAEPVSRILFYTSFIILISNTFLWPFVAAVFGVRLIAQAVIFNLVQKKLKEEGIIVFSIIFDIISPLIYFVLMISNTLNRSGKNKWK